MPRGDPLVGYRFILEVGGVRAGTFRTLSVDTSPVSHKIAENLSAFPVHRGPRQPAFRTMARPPHAPGGAGAAPVKKIPGRLKWHDVMVKFTPGTGPSASGSFAHKVRGDPRRGVTDRMEAWEWRKMVEAQAALNHTALKWQPASLELKGFVASGTSVPAPDHTKTGRIILLGDSGTPVARWEFTNAWPSKVSVPATRSSEGTSVTLVVDGLRRV